LEKQFSQNWISFKGFSVLDGFGTINHVRTMGLVVFLYPSGATKVAETHFKKPFGKA